MWREMTSTNYIVVRGYVLSTHINPFFFLINTAEVFVDLMIVFLASNSVLQFSVILCPHRQVTSGVGGGDGWGGGGDSRGGGGGYVGRGGGGQGPSQLAH